MRSAALAYVLCSTGLLAQGHPFGPPVVIDGPQLFTSTTEVVDADLDGRKDLVLGNGFPLDVKRRPAHVYRLGAGYQIAGVEDIEPTSELGVVSYPTILAADLDGDRFQDIVSVSSIGAVTVHRNCGTDFDEGLQSRFRTTTSGYRWSAMGSMQIPQPFHAFLCTGAGAADFNGDGHVDVAFSGEVRVLFDIVATIGVSLLPGNGKAGHGNEIQVLFGRIYDFRICDFDQDGRPDVVGLGSDGWIHTARNLGHFRFMQKRYPIGLLSDHRRLDVADLDGDGKLEYLISCKKEGIACLIRVHTLADGRPLRKEVLPIATKAGFDIECSTVDDFDRDGNPDLAVLLGSEFDRAQVRYFAGAPSGKLGAGVTIELDARLAVAEVPAVLQMLRSVDMDGDRNPELVISSLKSLSRERVVCNIVPNLTAKTYGWRYRGSRTIGRSGKAPQLAFVGGDPVLGNERFALTVRDLAPDEFGAVIFDSRAFSYSLASVQLHCFPVFSLGFVSDRVRGQGFAVLPLEIPKDPNFSRMELTMQALGRDPQAPNPLGVIASAAMVLRLSPY